MSKTGWGVLLLVLAMPLGFGDCAVYAATYGEASTRVVALLVIVLLLSLVLFLAGATLLALGMSRK
jgi:hypothetical protein